MTNDSNQEKESNQPEKRDNRKFWIGILAEKYEKILTIARVLTRNASSARDLAHIVVVKLLESSIEPASVANVDGYIYSVARNALSDDLRRERRVRLIPLEDVKPSELKVQDPRIVTFLETADYRTSLQLKRVKKDSKLAVTLMLLARGNKLPAIAQLLNEPVRTTRYRWYQYRAAQRKALDARKQKGR